MATLANGTVLRNRYQIIQLLGGGGFGETYLAYDLNIPTNPKPKCVVKRLLPQNIQPVVLRLFEKEAATLYKLNHPQIPKFTEQFQETEIIRRGLFGLFSSKKSEYYLIQEYVAGYDLSREILPNKQFQENDVIHLLRDLLNILAYVHQNQFTHRDIKPENIMRRQSDGKLVLIDFGIVKEMGSVVITQGQTRYTITAGTPGYMPAEQANGKPTYSSDVYAVGVMAIFALTGIRPDGLTQDKNFEIYWRKHASVSSGLADILDTMVRYDFRNRYKNAAAALAAIQSLPYSPPPTGWWEEERKRLEQTKQQQEEAATPRVISIRRDEERKRLLVTPPPCLPVFTFDVITVDNRGNQTSKVQKQAKYYHQNLGNGIFLDMVAIPGGKFLMGTPDSELERYNYESPQHQVTVPSFYMAKYPITIAQYQAIMGQNPSYFKGSDLPVEQVNWNNAVEFCQKLTQKTGQAYRLPSEAEWEYACRAGTTTPFHFGDTITTDLANYDGNRTYGNGPKGKYRETTTPVDNFLPNAWGLHDMHGNVWEWCQDRWHENYNNAPTNRSAWETGGESNFRVQRGGSWNCDPRICRSGQRSRGGLVSWLCNCGFRVAVSQLPVSGSLFSSPGL